MSHPFVVRPQGACRKFLRMWATWGKDNGYDYMIVVCDIKHMQDYPVFCMQNEFEETFQYASCCGQIREIYSFFLSLDEQIEGGIVMNAPNLGGLVS